MNCCRIMLLLVLLSSFFAAPAFGHAQTDQPPVVSPPFLAPVDAPTLEDATALQGSRVPACTNCVYVPFVTHTLPATAKRVRPDMANLVLSSDAVAVSPAADALVSQATPSQTLGKTDRLMSDGWPAIQETLLRFTVEVPSVERATLRLYSLEPSITQPTVRLAENRWAEGTVTWNTKPDLIDTATIEPRGSLQTGAWWDIDISKLIRGAGTYTLVLSQGSGDASSFAARESANAPKLFIDPGPNSFPEPPSPPPAPTPQPGTDATYYVSTDGDGRNPRSRSGAWRRLSDIQWSRIDPGDTLLITKGTYYESLVVSADGERDAPITVRFEPGTVLHGGRERTLQDCGSGWADGARVVGVDLSNAAYVVLDGQAHDGLTVRSFERGIELNGASHHLMLRNIEVTDNGKMENNRPTGRAINLAGGDIVFDRLNIHDNGHDALQATDQHIRDITVRNTWIHNSSLDNGCSHPDGLQVNGDSPETTNVLFERVVFGPGVYHNFLQQAGSVDGLTFRDVLSFQPLTDPWAIRGIRAQNIVFERVTSDTDRSEQFEITNTRSQVTIHDSIITGGLIHLPNDTAVTNSYRYDTSGDSIGSSRNPRYRRPADGDFTPTVDMNGAGSRVNSVSDIR